MFYLFVQNFRPSSQPASDGAVCLAKQQCYLDNKLNINTE